MYLPKPEQIKKDSEGTLILTESQYDALREEASISAAESGADREYDNNSEQYEYNFICTYLGTEDWIAESPEPDDGYDMDKYH